MALSEPYISTRRGVIDYSMIFRVFELGVEVFSRCLQCFSFNSIYFLKVLLKEIKELIFF